MGKRDWLELVARGIALYFFVRIGVDLVYGIYVLGGTYAGWYKPDIHNRLIGEYLATAISFALPGIWLWVSAPWLARKIVSVQDIPPSGITAQDGFRIVRYAIGLYCAITGLGALIGYLGFALLPERLGGMFIFVGGTETPMYIGRGLIGFCLLINWRKTREAVRRFFFGEAA